MAFGGLFQGGMQSPLMTGLANNYEPLLYGGMGMLSGSTPQQGWEKALKGLVIGTASSRERKRERAAEEEKLRRLQSLRAMMDSGTFGDISPEAQAFIGEDPELAGRLLMQQMKPQEGPSVVNNIGNTPSGWQVDPLNPVDPESGRQNLVPMKGGPGEQVASEVAGRTGLADNFLRQVPDLQREIASGAITGPVDRFAAKNISSSNAAATYRKMESGAEALQRMLTGAGMLQSEQAAYEKRYLPTYTDDAASMKSKLNQLAGELTRVRDWVLRGRGKGEPLPMPDGRFFNPDGTVTGQPAVAPADDGFKILKVE